jgi:hypothetical protein
MWFFVSAGKRDQTGNGSGESSMHLARNGVAALVFVFSLLGGFEDDESKALWIIIIFQRASEPGSIYVHQPHRT